MVVVAILVIHGCMLLKISIFPVNGMKSRSCYYFIHDVLVENEVSLAQLWSSHRLRRCPHHCHISHIRMFVLHQKCGRGSPEQIQSSLFCDDTSIVMLSTLNQTTSRTEDGYAPSAESSLRFLSSGPSQLVVFDILPE